MADTFPLVDFSAGELSPLTRGRYDAPFYYRGVEIGENYFPIPFGGVTRRPGTFLCDTLIEEDLGQHLLLPWDQKLPDDPTAPWRAILAVWEEEDSGTYYLKMKVITDVGNWGSGTFSSEYSLEVPAGVTYRFGDHCKYEKYDNTMFFACKGIPPFEIVNDGTPTGWTLQFTSFTAQAWVTGDYYSNGDIVEHSSTFYLALDISKDTTISAPNLGIEPGIHTDTAKYWIVFTDYVGPDFAEQIAAGEYDFCPSAVSSDRGRLIYGGAPADPMSMWGSRVRTPRAFNPGLADNAPWKHTISANETDIIQWIISSEKLVVGTSTAEFVLSGGQFGITPTNVQVETVTPHGSCDAQPVLFNELVLFMQSDRQQMRGYSFMDTIGRFYAAHMNIASGHIFEGDLRQMRLARSPRSALYSVRGDGQIVRFDYDLQSSLNAFFRWVTKTGHEFRSVAVLPAKGSDEDLVFVTVYRNGKTYLELFSWTDYFYHFDHPKATIPLTYGMYLDSATQVEVKEDAVGFYADGLSEYADLEVDIIVENAQHPPATVDSTGRVELQHDGAWAMIGFGYQSNLKSVNLGRIMKVKRTNQIGIRFIDTVGCAVGTTEDELEEIIFRDGETYYDEALALYSGDKIVDNPGGFDRDAYIFVRQESALPQTIVALVPWMKEWGVS